MKTKTQRFQRLLLFFSLLLLAGVSSAQTYTYQLYVTNQVRVSPRIYQFEVFMLNTTTVGGVVVDPTLELAGVQFGLGFDTNVVNGGVVTASIFNVATPPFNTELNAAETPTTVSIGTVGQVQTLSGIPYRFFNLAGRTPPGSPNGTVISPINTGCAHPGTRIGTFRLTNTVDFKVGITPKHVFATNTAAGRTQTAVTVYVQPLTLGATNTPITNTAFNNSYLTNPCDNNPVLNTGCNVTAAVTTTPVTCVGGQDGTATVTVSGTPTPTPGTGTYSLNGGPAVAYSTNPFTISGLAPGTYTITATTSTPCTTPVASFSITAPTLSMTMGACSHTDASCFGGSGTVSAGVLSNSSGAVSYTWRDALLNIVATSANATLPAGTYTLTVTDACTSVTCSETISQPTAVSASEQHTNVNCHGGSDGTITITASGGTSPYTVTPDPTGVMYAAGTYTFTVLDAHTCSAVVTVTITEPSSALVLSITAHQPQCFGDLGFVTFDSSTSGGTPPYVFDGGATINLGPGTYDYFNVVDANGCVDTATATIDAAPPRLNITITATQPQCSGDLGSVVLGANGGTPGYTFSPTTTTGLTGGIYTYTVTDSHNCSAAISVTINSAPSAVVLSAVASQPLCSGDLGSVSLSASGGTPGYSFSPTTTSGLSAGTYCYTVTDSHNCTATACVTINSAPSPLSLSATATQPNCPGDLGSISLSASGGSPGYSFSPLTTTGLVAGTYCYTVTDSHNCTATGCASIIAAPPALVLSATASQPQCNGDLGSVSLSATGGSPGYSFGTASTSGLSQGTYCYTVTDSHGCTSTACVTIQAAPGALVLSALATQPRCFGNLGSVALSATGGSPGYTFNPTTTSGLSQGTYCYTVTDSHNCTATACVTIQAAPTQLSITVAATQPQCSGNLGSVVLSASGGTPGYAFNPLTTTNLIAGTYCYTVTDGNACTATSCATIITAPPAVVLTATASQPQCNGDLGSVSLSATGGTPGYSFSPTTTSGLSQGTYCYTVTDSHNCTATACVTIQAAPSAVVLSVVAHQPTACSAGSVTLSASGGSPGYTFNPTTTTNLTAGTYCYTVTDSHGCTATACATISSTTTSMILNIAATQPLCFGDKGSVSLSVNGGAPPYSFNPTTTTNLSAGTYTYTVTDGGGCTATASVTINAAPAQLLLSGVATQIACNGGTGSISLTAGGGSPGYTINPTGTTNLAAGTYCYTVTDSHNCTATTCVTINNAPAPLGISATVTQPSCTVGTGSVHLSASGGTAPYTFTPNTTTGLSAGTYCYNVTDAHGCADSICITINNAPPALVLSATAGQIQCAGGRANISLSASGGTGGYTYSPTTTTNLAAGTYCYTVTDGAGCTATACATIAPGPPALLFTATANQIACNGGTGSVTLHVSGGTAPYSTDTLTPTSGLSAGTYCYTVMDSHGCTATVCATINTAPSVLHLNGTVTQISCNGSGGSISLSATGGTPGYTFNPTNTTNLAAGTYCYVVTDSHGCVDSACFTIDPAPLALTLTASATQIACSGGRGSVTLNVSGGTSPYTFGTTSTTNLVAGTYCYTVTDSHNCSTTACATIIPAPSALSINITKVDAGCGGGNTGSATANVSGGTPGYSFMWSTGDSSQSISNLAAGVYTVTVTDSHGCTGTASTTIGTGTPPNCTISGTTSICGGTTTLCAPAGMAGYLWSTGATTQCVTVNASGPYSVRVTNAAGCSSTCTATVTVGAGTCSITGSTTICAGGTTTLCGPPGALTYTWTTPTGCRTPSPAHTQCILANVAGTYTLVTTFAGGCSSTCQVVVTVAPSPTCSITTSGSLCSTAGVTLCATAGMSAYTWSNGATTQCITVHAAGSYSVTIRNAAGCSSTCSKSVSSNLSLSCSHNNSNCSNGFIPSVSVSVSGGTSPYTYLWNNGATTATVSGLSPGTYTVTVTDAGGCTATCSTSLGSAQISNSDYSSISANFNNTSIAANRRIWFSAVVRVTNAVTYPCYIKFLGQNINSTRFNLSPANGTLLLTNAVTTATTVWTGTEWLTTAPPNASGNYFISGFSYLVPSTISGNLSNVKWKGVWATNCPNVNVQWKWGAAVYTSPFPTTNNSAIGVKATDDNHYMPYMNSDHAGTPENYKSYLVAGARGGGGNNYTGSLSGSGTDNTPCAPSTCGGGGHDDATLVQVRMIDPSSQTDGSDLTVVAYPNPFTSTTTIEFTRTDKDCHALVEVYTMSGEKVATLFDRETEAGVKYSTQFHADGLAEGLYFYRIISSDNIINGKLILVK